MSPSCSAEHRFSGAFPAEAGAIAAIREHVGVIARECGLSDAQALDVRLGVSEVVTNAIVHAYGGPDGATAGQEVRVEVFKDADELIIIVSDDGAGVAPRLESPGLGLGLPIVASVTRRLELVSPERGGTEVHMAFPCPGA